MVLINRLTRQFEIVNYEYNYKYRLDDVLVVKLLQLMRFLFYLCKSHLGNRICYH